MKSTKVTDPSILAQLNGSPRKVTDPALLRQLNGEEPEDNDNLLQKIVRYGIKDPAIGVLNMGREFANLPHKLTGGYIPELSPSDYDFSGALGVEQPNTADQLIQFGGQYAPSFAIPGANIGKAGQLIGKIPGVGKFLARGVSEALPQAAYSAAQAPQDALKAGGETGAMVMPFGMLAELMNSPSKKVRGAAKIAAAGLGGLMGRYGAQGMGFGEVGSDVGSLIGAALGSRGFGTTKEMKQRLTEGVNIPFAEQRLKAAEQLNLDYLTPAEASINPTTSRRQGGLGRTEEGSAMLYEKGMQRQESERKAIEKTLDQIYSPGKMDQQVKEAYQGLGHANMPQEFPLQYKDNEIINEAKKMVESTPAYKESLKSLMPKNVELQPGQTDPQATSLVYWDHVKRAMDDMVTKAERAGNNNEARIISNTRAEMRDQMDAAYPEYAEARALYERKMVRKGLEKVFDQKEINGTNFYRALASQKKFDELLGHLKNAPEAAENLKAMRTLFNNLLPPPTIKTAKGAEERGMFQNRNTGSFLENLMEHVFTGAKNDKEAIAFITSKDWMNQMKELEKIKDKQLRLAALSVMIGKGIGQYTGQQERKPMELELVGGHR